MVSRLYAEDEDGPYFAPVSNEGVAYCYGFDVVFGEKSEEKSDGDNNNDEDGYDADSDDEDDDKDMMDLYYCNSYREDNGYDADIEYFAV